MKTVWSLATHKAHSKHSNQTEHMPFCWFCHELTQLFKHKQLFKQLYRELAENLSLKGNKKSLTRIHKFISKNCHSNMVLLLNTGHSRYVDFGYLDTTTYVEVIFHSQHFFPIFLCISTPSMSKTVNMKQRVSQGDFSCPRRIFYYNCYCLCRSIKSSLAWAPYCLFRLCTCIS